MSGTNFDQMKLHDVYERNKREEESLLKKIADLKEAIKHINENWKWYHSGNFSLCSPGVEDAIGNAMALLCEESKG